MSVIYVYMYMYMCTMWYNMYVCDKLKGDEGMLDRGHTYMYVCVSVGA